MADNDPQVEKDKKQLEQLDEEIQEARQHLKEQTHEGERSFIDDGTADKSDIDHNIAPPG